MVLLVKLLAIALIVYGCVILLRPSVLKKMVEYVKQGNRVYVASTVRVLIGILFVLAHRACRIEWVILFFGSFLIVSGSLVFILKREVIDKMIVWIESRTKKDIAILGGVVLLFGVILSIAA